MSVRSAAPRLLRAPRVPRLPRISPRLVAAIVAGGVLLFAGWLWLRDSSLVRVDRVTVTGVHGFGSSAISSALETAAQDMTTLHVDEGTLRAAVASFPLVKGVQVHASPPHALRIVVAERVPVGVIDSGSQQVAVADDGTLLRDIPVSGLPRIIVKVPPGGNHVGDRPTQAKVDLLAAAPTVLRARVTKVTLGGHGLTAFLDSGPQVRFGDGHRLHAKWIAAQRVMADPGALDATYIDVRVPERPAAGGLTLAQGGAPQSLTLSSADPAAVASGGATTAADGTATTTPATAAAPAPTVATTQPPAATTTLPATTTTQPAAATTTP